MLQDPGGNDANDRVIITGAAASSLRALSFDAPRAPASCGFDGAFAAPRWVLEFAGAMDHHLASARRPGSDVEHVMENAGKYILRGCRDPDFAAALLVVLEAEGLGALRALVV